MIDSYIFLDLDQMFSFSDQFNQIFKTLVKLHKTIDVGTPIIKLRLCAGGCGILLFLLVIFLMVKLKKYINVSDSF